MKEVGISVTLLMKTETTQMKLSGFGSQPICMYVSAGGRSILRDIGGHHIIKQYRSCFALIPVSKFCVLWLLLPFLVKLFYDSVL